MREKLARALCETDGHDPDYLEPGDDPYQNNTPVIDGYQNGEPCHFLWRHYDERFLDTIMETLREPTDEMWKALDAPEWGGRYEESMGYVLNADTWAVMIDAI